MKIINQNVNISKLLLKELHDFLSDVYIKGDFFCSDNPLTSLEGSPEKVGGNFFCSDNQLTSLEGSPEKIGVNRSKFLLS